MEPSGGSCRPSSNVSFLCVPRQTAVGWFLLEFPARSSTASFSSSKAAPLLRSRSACNAASRLTCLACLVCFSLYSCATFTQWICQMTMPMMTRGRAAVPSRSHLLRHGRFARVRCAHLEERMVGSYRYFWEKQENYKFSAQIRAGAGALRPEPWKRGNGRDRNSFWCGRFMKASDDSRATPVRFVPMAAARQLSPAQLPVKFPRCSGYTT